MKNYTKLLRPNNLVIMIFIVLLFLIHICIPNILIADDVMFSNAITNNENILEFLCNRYNSWSSRIIIEFIIVTVLHISFDLWKVLNILIWTLLVKSISKICMNDNYIIDVIICALVFVFPIDVINNTGWVATTMNYLWVVSLGCYSISIIIDYIKNKKISLLKVFLYLFACLYSTNQEQMAVVEFCVFAIFLMYELIKNKSFKILKRRKMLITLIIITICNLLLILLCPGNHIRKEIEIENWFPDYSSFNILQKVELGLTSTLSTLLLNFNTYYFMLTLFIFSGMCIFSKNSFDKILSSVPFSVCIFFIFFENIIALYFKSFYRSITKFKVSALISKLCMFSWNDILIFIIYILILLIIPISLYKIFKDKKISLICIGTYLLGLTTRFIMGFSPTVFGSGERTFIFLYVSFIICIVFILKYILEEKIVRLKNNEIKNRGNTIK